MFRRAMFRLITLIVVLGLCRGLVAAQVEEGKLRVLVITGGHGFEQEPFYDVFTSMPDVTLDKAEYPAAADLLNPAAADKYDVIVFYDMWAKGITPAQQEAFVKLLERGIGVVALHHTMGAHADWPEYTRIIGGKYYLQPHQEKGQTIPGSTYEHDLDMPIHIANAEHPITFGMQDFTIHDEAYKGYYTDPAATVLLTTTHEKSDRDIAWVKNYKQSRVFYMQLGHDHQAYENPAFRTLVARGIRWTADRPTGAAMPWQKLFNGRDLSGWKPEGQAVWAVEDGVLTGRQGAGNTPGDLFTEQTFGDFELTVTFRMTWPGNSGVWYRYQSGQKTYQADILEYKQPFALTGSLYCPGKMFIATNEDASIVDRDGWNTMVIRAAGTRQVIFLNGKKTADVRDPLTSTGTIGFQVHPGAEFGNMKIFIRDIEIRPL